ncbi:hypothetical protein [Streptomyces luteireticuli]|uniref:hypothetical protein n=1 Tax=Streptomyces luteireticuli TaxID=173858 RepID=UPI0035574F3D
MFGFLVRHFRAVGFTRDAVGHQLAGEARFAARRPGADGLLPYVPRQPRRVHERGVHERVGG